MFDEEMEHEDKEVLLILNNILLQHKKKCRTRDCFCRENKSFKQKSLLNIECLHSKHRIIFKAIYLIDELFDHAISRNGAKDLNLFYAYIEFLIQYKGALAKAYLLLHKHLQE